MVPEISGSSKSDRLTLSAPAPHELGIRLKAWREISFGYLQENTSFAPHSVDEYFVLQDKSTAFAVNGQTVIIDSEKLAKALLCLSERRREIILMRYYLQLRDKQIGALLGKPRTTVNYQKNAALKQLRTEMEKMNDEEQQIQPCSL